MSAEAAVDTAPPAQPDYTKLEGAALLEALGHNPNTWATAALQHAGIITGGHITHNFLRDWFATAMSVKVSRDEQAGFARAVAEVKQRELALEDARKALKQVQENLTAHEEDLHAREKALQASVEKFEEDVKAFEQFKVDKQSSESKPNEESSKGAGAPGPKKK